MLHLARSISLLPAHQLIRPLSPPRFSSDNEADLWPLNRAFPRADFNQLLSEQLEKARELKARTLSQPSLGERLLNFIEGPWAPENIDLPERTTFNQSGRAGLPYRTKCGNSASQKRRRELTSTLRKSERRWQLSRWTTVYTYDVPVRGLPTDLHDLTILHLSDIHLLKGKDLPWQELTTIARFVEQDPKRFDLVLISGDIITKGPEDLCGQSLKALERISTACPRAFMVHGNHDYHGHVPAFISQQLESVGFHDINNYHVRLKVRSAPLNIFGVDDAYFGAPKAPRNAPKNETNIILTHNLDSIRGDCCPNIDLILSGHTHWGELRLFNGSKLMSLWGYCDNANNHTRHWDSLTDRTLSFVHPGLARYYVPFKMLRYPPGIAIHTLKNHQ